MEMLSLLLMAFIGLATVVAVWLMVRRLRPDPGAAAAQGQEHAQLLGRLSQMAESHIAQQARMAEHMQAQERALTKMMEERLAEVSRRVGESLEKTSQNTQTNLTQLKERLAVIDAAQHKIQQLSGEMVSLQELLSNKQWRGAFGEIHLQDLVESILPPSAYEFQCMVGEGQQRVDCLLKLPNPPGPIAVDAKFPLSAYQGINDPDAAVRKQSAGNFRRDILKHVTDIAEKYIVSGVTAPAACLFLPSESVFAELHANFGDVVREAFARKVYIVSPTTLMATLYSMRAILKDAKMQEQAGLVQIEVGKMFKDVQMLDGRLEQLAKSMRAADNKLDEVMKSKNKILKRTQRIASMELEDGTAPDDLLLAEDELEETAVLLANDNPEAEEASLKDYMKKVGA
jgi:DNA recombination protein RmuC